MKLRRLNLSNDVPTSFSCISRSSTAFNERENSEPIPHDLIYELLLRLPAKSIARSRCLSKLWASILRSHDFTELFLTRSSTRQKLLFFCLKDHDFFFFTAPKNPDNNSSLVVPDYHMKFPFVGIGFQICGHVRGLVCLTHLRTVKGGKHTVPEICNPSTGQSLPLPKVKTRRRVNVRRFFAYDPIGKQFKVLSMTWPCYRSYLLCQEYKVLTIGTGKLSWRMVECSVPHQPISGEICINGCLYYYSMVDSVEHRYVIVCFDVTSEKLTSIRKPMEDVKCIVSNLVNYNGNLATLTSDGDSQPYSLSRGTGSFVLWVLQDAEKHKWSKHVYVLPPLGIELAEMAELYFVGVIGTDEIVLSLDIPAKPFYLFYYNIKRSSIVRVEIQGIQALKGRSVRTLLNHVENVNLM
ncbi:hypothetical protein BRARA_E01173 [Brassica rapa]|uniref:F-box domain-containing protein n=1 Tax=Brassica campestris TaxID=3711 RepID=A0A397ZAV5_BRACM|nr:hypothetical protein BRARA_E01173 [Brassica rapa]